MKLSTFLQSDKGRKAFLWSLVAAAVILVVYGIICFVRNLPMGLFLQLLILIVLILISYISYTRLMKSGETRKMIRWQRAIVIIYGIVAIVTLNHYFNPPPELFSNNDHHAIAVEGITVTRPQGFVLASNSSDAFFDNTFHKGRVVIADFDATDSTVTLRFDGYGGALYKIEKSDDGDVANLLNGRFSFSAKDRVTLYDAQNTPMATLSMQHYAEKEKCYKPKIRKVRYILEYSLDNETKYDTSWQWREIQKSYPLSSMFPTAVSDGVALEGLDLIRTHSRMDIVTNNKEADEYYSQLEWSIAAFDGSTVRAAAVNGGTSVVFGGDYSNTITVRADNSPYCFGLDKKVPTFRLNVDADGRLQIKYRLPLYRYLVADRSGDRTIGKPYQFMLASSVFLPDGTINQSIPDNLLLFNEFDHKDNVNNMEPVFISFQTGRSSDSLKVDFYDLYSRHQTEVHGIVAGGSFPSIYTVGGRAQWIVTLDNFKDPNIVRPSGIEPPHSAKKMMLILVAITVLSLFMLSLFSSRPFSPVETISYLVILTLVEIRLFLMWRVSVFPPVTSISIYEFNAWRSAGDSAPWIIYFLLAFYVSVFLIGKMNILDRFKLSNMRLLSWLPDFHSPVPENEQHRHQYNVWQLIWPREKTASIALSLLFVLYPVLTILFKIVNIPTVNVVIPVLYYFMVDMAVYLFLGGRYKDDTETYSHFWLSVFNGVIASVSMLILDPGYGIIFLFFTLVATTVRLAFLWAYHPFDKESNTGIRWWPVFVIMLALILCALLFSKWIAIHLLPIFSSTPWLIAIIVVFVGFVMAYAFGGFRRYNKIKLATVLLFVGLIAGGLTVLFQKEYIPDSHIENRALVHTQEPSVLIGQQTSKRDMKKFLEASLNDWVMQENAQRGKDVSGALGERGKGYLKLQPHSKVGVSWMTQLSDMSVSRFIIAEHDGGVPILIIVVFLIMFLIGIRIPSDRRWIKSLLVQIPLLLAIQSLIVWMAVTQRFIFVGQDFPMLSIISTANMALVFILFTIWVIIAAIEKIWLHDEAPYDTYINDLLNNDSNQATFTRSINRYFGILILGSFVAIVIYGNGREKNFYGENSYGVDNKMKELAKILIDNDNENSLNSLFLQFQDDALGNRRNITRLFPTYKDCVKSFYKERNKEIEDLFDSYKFTEYGRFAKCVFDNYISFDINENSLEQLLYVVKYRYTDENNGNNIRYSFGLSNNFFNLRIPKRIAECNRGNILMQNSLADTPMAVEQDQYRLYLIPGDITADGIPLTLLRPMNNHADLIGSMQPQHLERGRTYRIKSSDKVNINGLPVDLSVYGVGNYLAQRVFVNSKVDFIYPMGKKLYWARPFAQSVMYSKISDHSKSADVYLTLDKQMMEAVNNAAMTSDNDVAIVVADGDGYVRAFVEKKQARYRLDPNDSRRISRIEDSLCREGTLNWGKTAQHYFGHKALTSLRYGPGSSQKPIVWTAITSQFYEPNALDWNKIRMAKITNLNADLGTVGSLYAPMYTGVKFPGKKKPYFRSLKGDEGVISVTEDNEGHLVWASGPVDVRFYMRRSSNYYNSIMVQLGSFTRNQLSASFGDNSEVFARAKNSGVSKNDYQKGFPFINYNGRIYKFAAPVTEENLNNPESVLIKGLVSNFSLSLNPDTLDQLSKYLKPFEASDYAVPEASHFFNANRIKHDGPSRMRDAIKNTAIGQSTVWLVSPLKMAEMFGRLISLRKNYSLTIDPQRGIKNVEFFDLDCSIKKYLEMRNEQFIPGLREVFESPDGGTAHDVYNGIKNDLGNYFVYGKTGTIDGRTEEDHMLAVVITNRKLEELQSEKDLEELKFYVIYIADFDFAKRYWKQSNANIIKSVINSNEFKRYMGGK